MSAIQVDVVDFVNGLKEIAMNNFAKCFENSQNIENFKSLVKQTNAYLYRTFGSEKEFDGDLNQNASFMKLWFDTISKKQEDAIKLAGEPTNEMEMMGCHKARIEHMCSMYVDKMLLYAMSAYKNKFHKDGNFVAYKVPKKIIKNYLADKDEDKLKVSIKKSIIFHFKKYKIEKKFFKTMGKRLFKRVIKVKFSKAV